MWTRGGDRFQCTARRQRASDKFRPAPQPAAGAPRTNRRSNRPRSDGADCSAESARRSPHRRAAPMASRWNAVGRAVVDRRARRPTGEAPTAARPRPTAAHYPAPAVRAKHAHPCHTRVASRHERRRVAADPYPPISDRLAKGIGMTLDGFESQRSPTASVPRSPRTAIEPDTVDLPTRRSAGARHPLVVIGNAIISIFVLLAVVAGVVLLSASSASRQPGPLPQDRVVNIPHGSGMRDIADVLSARA